ncbi:MAG: hypothetical protein CVU11_02610 [Bacteroidetes bacterium HGW-Bacteroidetes-6]|nr:MAG: hypothetical protein CVU11_02610 [Bacteroidetes bacterium HGW-Bacteroidetes-6]
MNEVEKTFPLKDSLVEIYTHTILEYYNNSNNIEQEIELAITGKRDYEDDSILILSFDEILKFGSWHYTNSSLCFRKNGRELIPIRPSSDEKTLLNDFFQREMNYPNRIDGSIYQIIDLTGDGNPEFIFRSEGMVRDNFEERYNIYQLNVSNRTLEREKLLISSRGIQLSYPIIYGESREYKIIENDSTNPIIVIKEVISELDYSQDKVNELSCTFSYYVWDDRENQFVKLLLTKPKRH